MKDKKLKKILIVGDAGRGKSALAEQVSGKLSIEHHSTDDFYWKTKFTEKQDPKTSLDMALEVYREGEWIVEGTNTKLFTPGLDSADLIIHLVYPSIFAQWWRLVKREFGRKGTNTKEFMYLLRHVLYKRYGWGYKKGEMTTREILEPHKKKAVELSSFKEINKFVEDL